MSTLEMNRISVIQRVLEKRQDGREPGAATLGLDHRRELCGRLVAASDLGRRCDEHDNGFTVCLFRRCGRRTESAQENHHTRDSKGHPMDYRTIRAIH